MWKSPSSSSSSALGRGGAVRDRQKLCWYQANLLRWRGAQYWEWVGAEQGRFRCVCVTANSQENSTETADGYQWGKLGRGNYGRRHWQYWSSHALLWMINKCWSGLLWSQSAGHHSPSRVEFIGTDLEELVFFSLPPQSSHSSTSLSEPESLGLLMITIPEEPADLWVPSQWSVGAEVKIWSPI